MNTLIGDKNGTRGMQSGTWCCSLRHRYIWIVAVQHSGKIDAKHTICLALLNIICELKQPLLKAQGIHPPLRTLLSCHLIVIKPDLSDVS